MKAKNKIFKVSTTKIFKTTIQVDSPDPNCNFNKNKKLALKSDELMKNVNIPNKLKIKKTKTHSISIDNKTNINNKNRKYSDTNKNIFTKKNTFADKYQYTENKKFNCLPIEGFEVNQLNNFLTNTNLKQTIIIDNEGNNNLNLLLINNKNNNMKGEEKSETTSLFTNSTFQNNEKENGNNIIITENKKINDDKRINQYFKMFNLLNENIEQFKQIFNKENNINKNNIIDKEPIISGDNKIDTIIKNNINYKNNYIDNNNLNSRVIKNISKINITNNAMPSNSIGLSYNSSSDKNNDFNSSFVDSSLQEEFLNSLIETKKNFYDESVKINFESINKELEPESEYHIEKKLTKNKTLNPHFISNFNIDENHKEMKTQIDRKNLPECKIF